jgi:hypothetical protein
MITLLIEDQRHGAGDELAEVHVPLKAADEGYLWADAKDVCVPLQVPVGSHIPMVHARGAASDEIRSTDSLLLLLRSRQGVHYVRKVLTDISACFCGWRRDNSVRQLEG